MLKQNSPIKYLATQRDIKGYKDRNIKAQGYQG
jgi:hypothetical protein